MNLQEFSYLRNHCYETDNRFLIWQITPEDSSKTGDLDSEDGIIIVHILVLDGWMEVQYRERTHLLKKNDFGHFIHGKGMRVTAISNNINAYFMVTTDSYNNMLFKNTPPLPFSLVTKALKQPVSALPPTIQSTLSLRMQCIKDTAADLSHIFRNDMIKNAFMMFIMDMSDLHIRYSKGDKDSQTGRKKEIFVSFMKLLRLHAKQQHMVSFYASELCISQQYLNRIIKGQTEKTASEWICNSLVGEIVKMLEFTNNSMQQIAIELNFPDQATLSKFFKHQTGYSLTEYRKKINFK